MPTLHRHPRSETKTPHASLIPAKVVSKLVTHGPLDLPGKQLPIVAEVSFQSVSIDDDPVLIAIPRDAVSEVLTVRMDFGPAIGDDDSDTRQYLLEFVGQPIDCIDDQRLELIKVRRIGHTLKR